MFLMLFNKIIRMYYSLFVFLFYYKIIGLCFLNLAGSGLAGHGLTRLCGPGLGQILTGLDSNLQAWASPGL